MKNIAYVIGDPILQSKSPNIHNAAYNYLGINNSWHYEHKLVTSDSLADFIKSIKHADYNEPNIRGFSVTMPHKQDIIGLLDEVDELAKNAEAVNCVIRDDDGRLTGYNTDIHGIVMAITDRWTEQSAIDCDIQNNKLRASNALILGSGATARSAYLACKLMNNSIGIEHISIASRRKPNWSLGDVKALYDINDTNTLTNAIDNSDIIITTLPWDGAEQILTQSAIKTALEGKVHLECAFPKKLPSSIDGRIMLIHQAILQIELMTNIKIGDSTSEQYKSLFNVMLKTLDD